MGETLTSHSGNVLLTEVPCTFFSANAVARSTEITSVTSHVLAQLRAPACGQGASSQPAAYLGRPGARRPQGGRCGKARAACGPTA